jgi:hypothetical protein
MRFKGLGRLAVTICIWLFGVVITVPLLLSQLTYSVARQLEITPELLAMVSEQTALARESGGFFGTVANQLTVYDTVFAPWYFQLAVFVLCFLIVGGSVASTIVIWTSAAEAEREAARYAARAAVPVPLADLARGPKPKRRPETEDDGMRGDDGRFSDTGFVEEYHYDEAEDTYRAEAQKRRTRS